MAIPTSVETVSKQQMQLKLINSFPCGLSDDGNSNDIECP